MALITQNRILIESRIGNDGPSTGAATLPWLFLPFFSAHRSTLGRSVSPILQILLVFVLIRVLWLLVDAVLIPGMIRQTKQTMRDRLTLEALSQISATALPYDGAGETLPTPSRATLLVPR